MADAPFIFQAHAFTAWLLFAIWPFTRLVHAWSIPIAYVGRSPIVYRSRVPRRRRTSSARSASARERVHVPLRDTGRP